MYAYAKGDLFKSGAQALVNPVNIVGVMGNGLALQFRKRFPDMFRAYVRACKAGEVQPGRMWIYRTDMTAGPEFVICFPTKRHPRGTGGTNPTLKISVWGLQICSGS